MLFFKISNNKKYFSQHEYSSANVNFILVTKMFVVHVIKWYIYLITCAPRHFKMFLFQQNNERIGGSMENYRKFLGEGRGAPYVGCRLTKRQRVNVVRGLGVTWERKEESRNWREKLFKHKNQREPLLSLSLLPCVSSPLPRHLHMFFIP